MECWYKECSKNCVNIYTIGIQFYVAKVCLRKALKHVLYTAILDNDNETINSETIMIIAITEMTK